MTELCEVVVNAPDPEWLYRLTRALVADGLCASAHNFTPVWTVYKWQGHGHPQVFLETVVVEIVILSH
jgi:periplasmic divalent cation tolerance protein